MSVATKRKIDILNVKNIEEEIMLIKEAEEDYNTNGAMSAEESYKKGLDYINNLGK